MISREAEVNPAPVSYHLEAYDLSVAFNSAAGHHTVFEGVDLQVRRGEFCCIIGPSGCGKSTLLRVLVGLVAPQRGKVFFDGLPITGPTLRIGFVFQQFNLLPWRSLLANVRLGLENMGLPKREQTAKAEHWLNVVGLHGFKDHYPSQVSGGMQQRANLARALAIEPELLLMDEPFGSVDALTRLKLQSEVLQICEAERATVTFVTHDLDEALFLGDRVLVLKGQHGQPAKVVEELEVPFDRPRDVNLTRADPRFAELRGHLWNMLENDQAAPESTLVSELSSHALPIVHGPRSS